MAVSMDTTGLHHHHNNVTAIFRTDSNLSNCSFSSSTFSFPGGDSILSQQTNNNFYIEKRQLFLRSYQFSRKKTVAEKLKTSLSRVRRAIIPFRLIRSARRFRRLVWSRLRSALSLRGRRRSIDAGPGAGYGSWLLGAGSKQRRRSENNYWTDSGFWYKRIL